MPKIISRRGKPETPEIDIEINLGELEDAESIVVTAAGEDDDGQLTFEYYKEDWVIQHRFIRSLHDLGAWTICSRREQIWKIFFGEKEIFMVTETAIQSDLDTVLSYVRDMIKAVKDNLQP